MLLALHMRGFFTTMRVQGGSESVTINTEEKTVKAYAKDPRRTIDRNSQEMYTCVIISNEQEDSVKKHTDMLIFHTAICAGASQIATDGRLRTRNCKQFL